MPKSIEISELPPEREKSHKQDRHSTFTEEDVKAVNPDNNQDQIDLPIHNFYKPHSHTHLVPKVCRRVNTSDLFGDMSSQHSSARGVFSDGASDQGSLSSHHDIANDADDNSTKDRGTVDLNPACSVTPRKTRASMSEKIFNSG
jgi:hypothetical protein